MRACISVRIGRFPSIIGTKIEPMDVLGLCSSTDCDGSVMLLNPPVSIWNIPISLVDPNLFLRDRTKRAWDVLSPSSESTTSTICSSRRGPARSPSFVTCPANIVVML